MGQYPVGCFANTQVFSYWRIMGQAHNCFPVFFLYHYLTFYIHLTQSHLAVAIFSLMLIFHEIAKNWILCFLSWEWLRTWQYKLFLRRTDKLFPIEKVITDITYCLLKIKTITDWPFVLYCFKKGCLALRQELCSLSMT